MHLDPKRHYKFHNKRDKNLTPASRHPINPRNRLRHQPPLISKPISMVIDQNNERLPYMIAITYINDISHIISQYQFNCTDYARQNNCLFRRFIIFYIYIFIFFAVESCDYFGLASIVLLFFGRLSRPFGFTLRGFQRQVTSLQRMFYFWVYS